MGKNASDILAESVLPRVSSRKTVSRRNTRRNWDESKESGAARRANPRAKPKIAKARACTATRRWHASATGTSGQQVRAVITSVIAAAASPPPRRPACPTPLECLDLCAMAIYTRCAFMHYWSHRFDILLFAAHLSIVFT